MRPIRRLSRVPRAAVPALASVFLSSVLPSAAADAARWLGRAEQAVAWSREYEDFLAAFRRAAARDLRDDGRGNTCLPIVMNAPADLLPQKAQWAFLHAVHPGGVFAAGDPIVRGNMAMLAAREREEQRPVGEKPGYVGDMPHNWAARSSSGSRCT